MKTFIYKNKQIKRQWHLVDAKEDTLGRLSVKIAKILSGKEKTYYSPHQDLGDFVVVVNATNIKVTGKKFKDKEYHHYSGYPGGLSTAKFKEKFNDDPKWIITHSVRGMLPSNKLRAPRLNRLKIYLDEKHPHKAQIEEASK